MDSSGVVAVGDDEYHNRIQKAPALKLALVFVNSATVCIPQPFPVKNPCLGRLSGSLTKAELGCSSSRFAGMKELTSCPTQHRHDHS